MCRSSRHSELATSRLSTAFRERGDTCEQVMEAEQRAKTKTSEGNPGNSNGDAVDVVPPVGRRNQDHVDRLCQAN